MRQFPAVVRPQDHDVPVLLDHDAGQHPAVGRGDDRRREALADLGRGVDDVQQHGVEVVAAVGGQVGSDLASLAEEGVASRARPVEEGLARLGHAGAGSHRGGQAVDLGAEVRRGGRPDRAEQAGEARGQVRVAEHGELLDHLAGHGLRIDGPASIASTNRAAQVRRVASKLWAADWTSSDMFG